MASDERTVPEVPTMRQLDNGAIVSLTSILKALEDLDKRAERVPATFSIGRPAADQRSAEIITRWRKRPLWQRGKRDDDDEPPPVPLAMRVTPAWA